MARVLGSSLGKLHDLQGALCEGSDRAEVGGKGVGHGGFPRVALAGRGEVAGAMGELGGVRRGREEAMGMMAGHQGGLYSCGTGVVTGRPRARGVRVRACSERAPECQPTSNTWELASAMVQRRI